MDQQCVLICIETLTKFCYTPYEEWGTMRRIERINLLCSKKSQFITREMIYSGQEVGMTASEIADELQLLRNNVSADLNNLVKDGQLIKILGKPTRFVAKTRLTNILGIKYIGQKECATLTDLIEKLPVTTNNSPFDQLIGSKKSLAPVVHLVEAAITYPPHGLHTIIFGESGTGKSLLAEKMFEYGRLENMFPEDSKLVILNCADYATNPQLLLSQLFGSVKGAYTGADTDRTGLIEEANGGILFLDEIHRLPPEGQEMLFHYIDKNCYFKLGDTKNSHYANALLIAATTESPNSVLLETFKRRIPVTVQMPNLNERSFSERLELINFLYEKEAHRIDTKIQVKAEAIKPLMSYYPEGNIGQIKSDVQLSIARALLEKKKSNQPDVLVTKDFFSPTVTKSLLKLTNEDKREINLLVGNKDFTFGQQTIAKMAPKFDYDFLAFFEQHEKDGDSLDKLFNDYTQEIAKQSIKDENFSFFLNEDIKGIVLTISDILYEDLGIIIDKNINIALSLYIYSHTEENAPNFFKKSVSAKRLPERIIKTVRKIIKQLESKKQFYFKEADIEFLAMIIESFQKKEKKKEIALFICAHGDSVASEISRTTNDLLNNKIVYPIDMGLDVSPSHIYETLKIKIQMVEEKDVILFVDMGSIASLEANLIKDTAKNVIIIESIEPLMILETAQNVENLSMDFNTCIERIQQINKQKYANLTRKIETHFELGKKKIIYTVCTTAEGSAQFLKENLKNILRGMNIFDIDVKAIRGDNAAEIMNKMKSDDVLIVAIVGTINPNIAHIPFVSLQEVVLQDGIRKILQYADIGIKSSDKQEIVTFNREVIIDMGIDSIDKYLYLLSADKMKKSLNAFVKQVETAFGKKFANDVVLKLIIHTACLIERILLNNSEITLPQKDVNKEPYAQMIKLAFEEIEREYNIVISIDECYFIAEIIE